MSCGTGECGCGCGDLVTLKSPRDKKQEKEKHATERKEDLSQEQNR